MKSGIAPQSDPASASHKKEIHHANNPRILRKPLPPDSRYPDHGRNRQRQMGKTPRLPLHLMALLMGLIVSMLLTFGVFCLWQAALSAWRPQSRWRILK